MEILGIHIRKSSIKGAVVDTRNGSLLSGSVKTVMLEDTTPHKVLAGLHQLISRSFRWDGPLGCALPATVRRGIVISAPHIHHSWVDADANQLFSDITENPVSTIYDADAANIAELHLGAAKNHEGLIIFLTMNPHLISSMAIEKALIPNSELQKIEIHGQTIATYADEKLTDQRIRKKERAKSIQKILEGYDKIFHPSLFVLGGDIFQETDHIFPYLKIQTTCKPVRYDQEGTIIGAALAAEKLTDK